MSKKDLKKKTTETISNIKDLEKEAREELLEEKKEMILPVLKERIKEIELAERTLQKLKEDYQELLDTELDDYYYEQ